MGSIGSLGHGRAVACVSNVTVQNSVIKDSSNGVRIKTYQGGQGMVRNVVFRNLKMVNVQKPIVMNQVRGPRQGQKCGVPELEDGEV